MFILVDSNSRRNRVRLHPTMRKVNQLRTYTHTFRCKQRLSGTLKTSRMRFLFGVLERSQSTYRRVRGVLPLNITRTHLLMICSEDRKEVDP